MNPDEEIYIPEFDLSKLSASEWEAAARVIRESMAVMVAQSGLHKQVGGSV